jgi:regulator of sigma E protease
LLQWVCHHERVIYVVVILAFAAMIIVHEFGHFLGARALGMRVEKFSIGFGPTLWSAQRGDTVFQVAAFPLGGFVRVAGMSPEDEVQPGDLGSYANHAAWRRFLVIAAGPIMNYVMAALVLAVLLAVGYSEPDPSTGHITVVEGKAAARAGLRSGDLIRSYAGKEVNDFFSLREAITAGGEGEVVVVYERGGERRELKLKPDAGPVLGVNPGEVERAPVALHLALWLGVKGTWDRNAEVVGLLYAMIFGKVKARVGGPPEIVRGLAQQLALGFKKFMQAVWNVSIAIALFNFLPLPALDGGRLAFLFYELVTRRRVNPRFEAIVHAVGLLLLLGLIIVISVGDIRRWIGGS